MVTVELTEREARIVRSALQSFLGDFGHDQADLVREVRAVLQKFQQAETDAGAGAGAPA
jgi:hypothetical protein